MRATFGISEESAQCLTQPMRQAVERKACGADRITHESAEAIDCEWLAVLGVDDGNVLARWCRQRLLHVFTLRHVDQDASLMPSVAGAAVDLVPRQQMRVDARRALFSIKLYAVRCFVPIGQRFSNAAISRSVQDLILPPLGRLMPAVGSGVRPKWLIRMRCLRGRELVVGQGPAQPDFAASGSAGDSSGSLCLLILRPEGTAPPELGGRDALTCVKLRPSQHR